MTDFQTRRMEFADKLRGYRERAGLSGKEFAALIGWTNSKVSKIETGKQTATDSDLTTWLATLNIGKGEHRQLAGELRELRIQQISWRRELRAGHRARQAQDANSEREAREIRAFELTAVPGLLQTPDYARAIFASQVSLLDVPDDIDASVTARMERQRILYEPGRMVEILMIEAALRLPVAGTEVMAAQVDRLISAVGLPNLRFGIIPLDRPLPHVPWHGFWIIDDVVLVELVSSEVRIDNPDDVEIYRKLTDRLWSAAVEGDEARAVLARIAADLRP